MFNDTMHQERWTGESADRHGMRRRGRHARRHGMRDGFRMGFGGPGHRGRGRRGGPRAGRGDVRSAVLMLLAEQPMHGYEIIQQIGERSGGAWQPSPGSVYPALQMLEDQGLIQAEEAEGRRTFTLTDAGNDHVEQHREELNAVWSSVQGAASDATRELRDLMDQVGMAAGQVARVGAPAQLAAARDLLTTTRQQLYRILAEDAPETSDDAAQ